MAIASFQHQLPTGIPVCYKPYMRKWMSEKLKRRKKTPEEVSAEPAPLQPAYFNPEPQGNIAEPPASRPVLKPEPVPESSQPIPETDFSAPAPTGGVPAVPRSAD